MNERAIQKQKTRERILEKAIAYVGAKGFLAFDTAGIAREAGLSHGALFSHFPRREDLLIAVIRAVSEKMTAAMDKSIRHTSGPRSVLEAQLRIASQYEDLFCHLIAQVRYLPDEAQHWWTILVSTASFHLLEALPPDQRDPKKSTLWWALLGHYCLNARLYSAGEPLLNKKASEIIDLWSSSCQTTTGNKT